MARELIIYCDESDKKGKYYSNFYGGALVRSSDLGPVQQQLEAQKRNLNLYSEVKWSKVTSVYLDKYKSFMDTFLCLVFQDKIKIRIMFTKNSYIPGNLDNYHRQHEYHILYYYFLKFAFGLEFSNPSQVLLNLRIYLDKLPDKKEKNTLFKSYLAGLNNYAPFLKAGIKVKEDQIAEVNSHYHVILQGLDIILGSMAFRLNNKHKNKPPGSTRRAKRTIAKEKLYKHINRHIRLNYPYFNVGKSTGVQGSMQNRWRHPYRHWMFIPRDHTYDPRHDKP